MAFNGIFIHFDAFRNSVIDGLKQGFIHSFILLIFEIQFVFIFISLYLFI